MASPRAILCWRLLHLCLDIAHFFNTILERAIALCFRSPPLFFLEDLCIHHYLAKGKRPIKSIAIVLDPEEARSCPHDRVVELLKWLRKVGIPHVSLYDPQGLMKASQHFLEDEYYFSTNKAESILFYQHKDQSKGLLETGEASLSRMDRRNLFHVTNGIAETAEKRTMAVELLSREDGKEAVVKAANHLWKSHQKTRFENLSEADVNESMMKSGVGGPDPDLLIIFGAAYCLWGFPPWRIRLTEILHFGSLQNLTIYSFLSLLKRFSNKTHRYGK